MYNCINRTNADTLRFIVKALTFCAFIGNNIIVVTRVKTCCTRRSSVVFAKWSAIYFPVIAALIYWIVRAFWFACTAVDTFFCYFICHYNSNCSNFISQIMIKIVQEEVKCKDWTIRKKEGENEWFIENLSEVRNWGLNFLWIEIKNARLFLTGHK